MQTDLWEQNSLTCWWAEGLRFECVGCGRCCRGEPGGVFMLPEEERRIAELLNVTVEHLRFQFETTRWQFPSLKEMACGRCIMSLPDNRCRIYSCRPISCRTWPFWPELLESPDSWARAAQKCPGMNTGRIWENWRIRKILRVHIEHRRKLMENYA